AYPPAAGEVRLRGERRRDRGSARPRPAGARAGRTRRGARVPPDRRARPPFLGIRRGGARRPPAAPAPAGGIRSPQRARVRTGRVATARALALDGQTGPADG